jgi:hypothetical protein
VNEEIDKQGKPFFSALQVFPRPDARQKHCSTLLPYSEEAAKVRYGRESKNYTIRSALQGWNAMTICKSHPSGPVGS